MTTHKAMVTDAAVERMARWLAKNEGLDPDLKGSHFHEDPVWMEFADDAREALALAQAETQPVAWQPIETAPISNGSNRFLAYVTGHGVCVCYAGAVRFIYSASTNESIHRATHWMPLPLAPGASPVPAKREAGVVLTPEQKEITLLRIIDGMGGRTDSSDYPGNWLTWFCSDEIHDLQEDTFNRCNDKGWLHTTHDTSFDTSTTTLTAAGRAALATSSTPADGEATCDD